MRPPTAEQTWAEWIQRWPTHGLKTAEEDKAAAD